MQTPSHLLINASLRKGFKIVAPRSAIFLGAIMPDIPLGILSIGTLLYYRLVLKTNNMSIMSTMFDNYYFNNPWWIASHNMLHSPTLLLIILAVLWRWRSQVGTRLHWAFWFFSSCLMHTAVDIPTHVDDGPVLFFPFDWHTRFHSAVSYWDRRYYGEQFAIFEAALDLTLLVYLLGPIIWRRIQRRNEVQA